MAVDTDEKCVRRRARFASHNAVIASPGHGYYLATFAPASESVPTPAPSVAQAAD